MEHGVRVVRKGRDPDDESAFSTIKFALVVNHDDVHISEDAAKSNNAEEPYSYSKDALLGFDVNRLNNFDLTPRCPGNSRCD